MSPHVSFLTVRMCWQVLAEVSSCSQDASFTIEVDAESISVQCEPKPLRRCRFISRLMSVGFVAPLHPWTKNTSTASRLLSAERGRRERISPRLVLRLSADEVRRRERVIKRHPAYVVLQ